ncbi:MAG: cache domain-containing protein [Moritella sp.]|uniref:cache domain-containing protein n=1 Tax=Moritella sp. TaxID=78556 RepID=UPI0029BBBA7E|nr:cache domain-containing protein [Moritella sp.]MDX2322154.1 cache domain-containing protein [Moritella sp.]
MLKYKLSRVFFSSMVTILLVLFAVIYFYSVPLINKKVYETERNSSRMVLDNVVDLANKMKLSLAAYQREALDGHKRNMKSVIDLAEAYVASSLAESQSNKLTSQQAYAKLYEGLRSFTYGKGSYVWIADQQSTILSHPDPYFYGMDASDLRDANGELVFPTVILKARSQGAGFYQYPWRRLGESIDVEKISYVKYFPEWDFFIGTGIYIDDIKQGTEARRAEVITDLRQSIKDIVIADTGYLFIFDEQGNMLVHPNDNIEATNALLLKNPMTGQSILQELIAVADTGNELIYQWDRPTEPNNYIYEKLSLVRHIKGLGWYICSSVYTEELQSSGKLLSQRIILIGLLALFVAIIFALLFSNWVTYPITQLAAVAKKVSRGDLTLKSGIKRQDEFGVLGHAFDQMVTQLRDNITNLDLTIASRTEALVKSNQQLQLSMLESQRVQQQLMQAQRMNAVGQLAGGLAHDFNNILTIILGNLVAAERCFPENNSLLKKLAPAIRASRRGSDITNRLLAFSRRQPLQPRRINIADLIDETVELIKDSLPSTIVIKTHFSSYRLQASVDPSQLENCLINLMLNAKDAMPKGGDISINVSDIDIASNIESGSHFDEPVEPGKYLVIDVIDHGCGFTRDAMNMAFEPFYTTKSSGQGSGLGLSMVFGFIKQSRGFINLSNGVNAGAKVTLLLPLLSYQALPERDDKYDNSANNSDFTNKLMLLVEDDFDVRAVVREQLISFGFNVIEATDSDEAEQLMMAIPHLFGMLSDISMPGSKTGFELADSLLRNAPASKVILMSGYVFENNQSLHNIGKVILLRKPFSTSELGRALDNSVDQATSLTDKDSERAN